MLAMVLSALALAMTAQETGTKPPAPRFDFQLKKAEDAVKPVVTGDRVVFEITNKSGIGAAEITLVEGAWPKQVVLRFVDASEYLEHFEASNGALTLQGSLRQYPKTTLLFDRAGKLVTDSKQAALIMTLQHDAKQRVKEVTLPPGFCTKDTKTLRVDWIDAFRR